MVSYGGWRWTQWTLLSFIAAAYIGVFCTGETYKKVILKKRAKKAGQELPSTGPKGIAALKFLLQVTLTRPIHMLVSEPIVMFLSIWVAFNFATVYCFFVAFPPVFAKVYGFTAEQGGLTFISIIIGSCLGALLSVGCDMFFYQKLLRRSESDGHFVMTPEMRLYSAMIGSILSPVGLFWFAWTAEEDIHWICPMIANVFIACGNVAIFISVALYLIETYQALLSASALAANGILRYIVGAVFPLFTLQMYERLGVQWATSLLGFVALAMMPIPWVLYQWGNVIRARSEYATTEV